PIRGALYFAMQISTLQSFWVKPAGKWQSPRAGATMMESPDPDRRRWLTIRAAGSHACSQWHFTQRGSAGEHSTT
ncbi:MAG TPA: hypothetical protein VHY20_14250, partial [Pirellulales bacterium]|nr:hypothetical protein [Pirellulales bacterium]